MVNQLLKIISEGIYWGLVAFVAITTVTALMALLHIFSWFISSVLG